MRRKWQSLLVVTLICSLLFSSAMPVSATGQSIVGPNEAGSAGYYVKSNSGTVTYHEPVSMPDAVLNGYEGTAELELPPTAVPNTVIGPDTRVEVEETRISPYRSIALIVTDWPHKETTVGTAFFIGPNALATAGHNLYDPESGNHHWATKVMVYPGATNGVPYYGEHEHTNLTVGGEWFDYGNPMDDWGIIHIGSNVGNTTGWISARAWTLSEVIGRSCTITGYPKDLQSEDATQGEDWVMYTGSGQIISESFRALPAFSHNVDTEQGDSGAPVYGYDSGIRVVYGIHNYGRYRNYETYDYNHAVLINEWLMGAFTDATN